LVKCVKKNKINILTLSVLSATLLGSLVSISNIADASTSPYNFNFSVQGNEKGYPIEVFSNKKYIFVEFSKNVKPLSVSTSDNGVMSDDTFKKQYPYYVIPYYGKRTEIKTTVGFVTIIDNSFKSFAPQAPATNELPVNINTSSPKVKPINIENNTHNAEHRIHPVNNNSVNISNLNSVSCNRSIINVGENKNILSSVKSAGENIKLGKALDNIIPSQLSIALSKTVDGNMKTNYRAGNWVQSLRGVSKNNYLCSLVDWNNDTVFVTEKGTHINDNVNGGSTVGTQSSAPQVKPHQLTKIITFTALPGQMFSHSLREFLIKNGDWSMYFGSPLNLTFKYRIDISGKSLKDVLNKLGKDTGYSLKMHKNHVVAVELANTK
jgi:hypothetical protein